MRLVSPILLILLVLLTLPFVAHSLARPMGVLLGQEWAMGRLFRAEAWLSNLAIFAHMASGAVLTLAAPLQILRVVRRKWPRLHRISGYVLFTCALLTGIGGLIYIGLHGTIGGAWMSGWFALYGVLTVFAAMGAVHFARRKDFVRHRRWALRLVVLALGSFFYRVHYGLWMATTGGIGVDDFYGPFFRAMVWAFYLPYLALLELWLYAERRRTTPSRP